MTSITSITTIGNPSDYNNELTWDQSNTSETQKIDVKKITPIQFLIGKIDYQYYPSPSFTIETGMKGVISNLDNTVSVKRWNNNVWAIDPLFTSDANLKEKIGAAYIAAKWRIKNSMQINGGIRYEFTSTFISTPAKKGIVDRRYGYLFPSFFFKKDIAKEKDFQLSYSRRITRPTFNDIAPFVFFWNPNTFSAGNTSLWPAISDVLKVSYHSGPWIFSTQFSHSKNEISFFQPEIQPESNNLIYRSQNLRYLKSLSLSNSWSFNVTSWWEVQSNLIAQYQSAHTAHLENNTTLNVYNVNINLINTIKFPKDISIEVSGFYQSRSVFGISQFLPLGALNAGIQKKFGNKGTLRFSMDDILYTNYWRINTNIPQINLDSEITYDMHLQSVRLTYSRNFGNNKLRSVHLQSGSEEERRRITN